MTHDQNRDLLHRIAILEERLTTLARPGTVDSVSGDKIRINHGIDQNGQPLLSPWLHTHNHRGGARERRFWKKGQNVMLMMPTGDPRQAIIFPYAPNNNFKAPDQADSSGPSAETYQLSTLHTTKVDGGHEVWLGYQGSPTMNLRIDKSGGITGRVNKDMKFAAHSQGVKLKSMSHGFAIFIDATGIWSTQPIEVKADPIPDDEGNGFTSS